MNRTCKRCGFDTLKYHDEVGGICGDCITETQREVVILRGQSDSFTRDGYWDIHEQNSFCDYAPICKIIGFRVLNPKEFKYNG